MDFFTAFERINNIYIYIYIFENQINILLREDQI